jgi:hypothetical protein
MNHFRAGLRRPGHEFIGGEYLGFLAGIAANLLDRRAEKELIHLPVRESFQGLVQANGTQAAGTIVVLTGAVTVPSPVECGAYGRRACRTRH